jgi:hypothetical protein
LVASLRGYKSEFDQVGESGLLEKRAVFQDYIHIIGISVTYNFYDVCRFGAVSSKQPNQSDLTPSELRYKVAISLYS